MRGISLLSFAALVLCSLSAMAQVLSPMEVADPGPRMLQDRYMGALQAAATELEGHKYPYHFYFSRVMDVEEKTQLQADQRSIRFAKLDNQTVLEITGNYYAAYYAPAMDPNARARQTFLDVIVPVMKVLVPQFPNDDDFQAFAFEISHHVRGKILGVRAENAENLVVIVPRAVAKTLVNATTLDQQQSAILEAKVMLDGDQIPLWLSDQPVPADWKKRVPQRAATAPKRTEIASLAPPPVAPDPSVSSRLIAPNLPVRLIAPDTLKSLQSTHDEVIARMVKEIGGQANFVSYAPPAFIAFHQGAYLQLSMTTSVERAGNASRYAAAALAFDNHISHLVRPVLAFFQQDSSFDGVDFSTTVKMPGAQTPLAVEFLLPFSAMRCYAQYDCTGQQLIEEGIVLINGERAGLDLQRAEAERPN